MARSANKLSTLKIKSTKEPGLYADGGNLYLQVSQEGTKSWLFRFMIAGRARKMGLGSADYVPLAEARKKAAAAYGLLIDGVDPIDERDQRRALIADQVAHQKAERSRQKTFKQCAEAFIANKKAGWKNPKSEAQWTSSLKTYAYPFIGDLRAADIDLSHVKDVLEPIWRTKTETANRVRGRIEMILNWAAVHNYRSGENPARWRGHLDMILSARSEVAPVKHHEALPYSDIPKFMADLRKRDSISARALEYTILTAVRTSDTIGGVRTEVDEKDKVWTIPAARLKGKKGKRKTNHTVPLSKAAFTILEMVPHDDKHLFAGGKEGQSLSNMAMAELLKSMGYGSITVHGFRSTFRDWAAEKTAYPNEMCELALAHVVSDKVEAAYRRGDMREKRRRLMEDWAKFCASPAAAKAGNVVSIRAANK